MIKKLRPIGNSLGLIIDKPILELLKITKDTPLEITTDGVGLMIRPASESEESFEDSADFIFDRYEDAFRRLAE